MNVLFVFLVILLPLLTGLLAFFVRSSLVRKGLLVGTALIHALACLAAFLHPPAPLFGGWVWLDSLGILFLGTTSLVFLAASLYSLGLVEGEKRASSIFTGCLLLFLATMSAMAASQHFGLYWIALEASTLASAPLIYHHRHQRSLEATWKYLMLCSIGIALALLGMFFLAIAGDSVPLVLPELLKNAAHFHPLWLKAAFLLFLIGYGTKMGLVPLHTWLPDAHSESPSVASALLSGALLNCSFLGILRAYQVCLAANQGAFCEDLLRGFGLLSLVVAAIFILNQSDFKRMLAYSSIEHMGILALGVGIGGAATFGAMLHTLNHSLVKAMLFLLAGNIFELYGTKKIPDVRGLLKTQPATGALWVAGFFAISGFPPFGTFLSEFSILKGALEGGFRLEAVLFLLFLALIFIGMATGFLRIAQGSPRSTEQKISRWMLGPPAILCALALAAGLFLPAPLQLLVSNAAKILGGAS
ncbi:MAG: proton-conducting transporter membrane subunit [Bacteroidota bacterium]